MGLIIAATFMIGIILSLIPIIITFVQVCCKKETSKIIYIPITWIIVTTLITYSCIKYSYPEIQGAPTGDDYNNMFKAAFILGISPGLGAIISSIHMQVKTRK